MSSGVCGGREMAKNVISDLFTSRWGDAELDDKQYAFVPGWIMRHYHRFEYAGEDTNQRGKKVGLTPDEFQVMVHIMSFKYDAPEAEARPSLMTIAEQMGKHVSSVRRTVKRLKEKGALKVQPKEGKPSVYDFGELARQCRQYEKNMHATTSVDASTSTDAKGTPSVDASTPLAYTLGEDIKKESEDKNKSGKRKRSAKQQEQDAMIEALVDALGLIRETITNSMWSELRGAAKELLEGKAKPEDMAGLHAWCTRQRWSGNWGAFAMAKNWPHYCRDENTRKRSEPTTKSPAALSAERALYGEEEVA